MTLISICTNCSPDQQILPAIFIVLIIFWFFMIRDQGVISTSIPKEHFSDNFNVYNYSYIKEFNNVEKAEIHIIDL